MKGVSGTLSQAAPRSYQALFARSRCLAFVLKGVSTVLHIKIDINLSVAPSGCRYHTAFRISKAASRPWLDLFSPKSNVVERCTTSG